jgi:hypothetical protein
VRELKGEKEKRNKGKIRTDHTPVSKQLDKFVYPSSASIDMGHVRDRN